MCEKLKNPFTFKVLNEMSFLKLNKKNYFDKCFELVCLIIYEKKTLPNYL